MRILYMLACAAALTAPAWGQQAAPSAKSTAASAATAQPAPPAHPITLEQTRKMFQLMDFNVSMDSMMDRMISMQSQQAPFIPASVWDDMRATFKKTDFVVLFLPTYQKYLSEYDAQQAIEFYSTPAGKHMLKSLPLMMADVSTVASQKGQEIARGVIDRHMDEIQAAQKKYQEQAPAGGDAPAPAPAPAESPK
jgi:hypothetical protein